MAFLSDIINNVKDLRSGGIQSDDLELLDEQVIFIVNYYRAKLIRQQTQKHPNAAIFYGLEQNLGKVTLEDPDSTSSFLPKKSKISVALPLFVNLPVIGPAVRAFGRSGNPYQYVPPNRFGLIQNSRSSAIANSGYYTVFENKIAIRAADLNVEKIPISGIFDDPIKAKEFAIGSPVEDFDFEYPISGYMLDTIYKLIVETELPLTLISNDNINNTRDDTLPQ